MMNTSESSMKSELINIVSLTFKNSILEESMAKKRLSLDKFTWPIKLFVILKIIYTIVARGNLHLQVLYKENTKDNSSNITWTILTLIGIIVDIGIYCGFLPWKKLQLIRRIPFSAFSMMGNLQQFAEIYSKTSPGTPLITFW
jgi:hypothetical protein